MTPENFCYWLQGLIEIGNPESLDKQQLEMIERHLKLVFNIKSKFYKRPSLSPIIPHSELLRSAGLMYPKIQPDLTKDDLVLTC